MGNLTKMSEALMGDYVSRPRPIRAVQVTDENARDVATLVHGTLILPNKHTPSVRIYFYCCNGRVKAEWGDWIYRDSTGFHKLTNDEFTERYEERP